METEDIKYKLPDVEHNLPCGLVDIIEQYEHPFHQYGLLELYRLPLSWPIGEEPSSDSRKINMDHKCATEIDYIVETYGLIKVNEIHRGRAFEYGVNTLKSTLGVDITDHLMSSDFTLMAQDLIGKALEGSTKLKEALRQKKGNIDGEETITDSEMMGQQLSVAGRYFDIKSNE